MTKQTENKNGNAPLAVEDILRGTAHALTIFKPRSIAGLSIFLKKGKPYLTCYASAKERPAKPEEIVRQLYIKMLMDDYGYPVERIAVEKPVQFGSAVHEKAADIVVWDKDDPNTAFIIVECKKPKRADGLEQLKSYCHAEGAPIGVWTSGGGETIFLHRRDPNYFQNLPAIPRVSQTLSELLDERWTLDDLAEHNVLVKEQTTLKKIILDMENLVLAHAGVDAFEEVFKLIYAKLYDEAQAAQGGKQKRYLQFRVGGGTPNEFKRKINDLFDKAKAKWPGVFLDGEHIDLTPEHLITCGSYLENVKLFNSNLQVIDEAFEYLSKEVWKGKKGQYFTPRHVIDMAVKMLNPTADEYTIDTAAGSCGFTVHTIFHVWGNEFTAGGPTAWQSEYAREKVYAIDFDGPAIKIAKALNLIAGDGRTNVYRTNTLDPRGWDDSTTVGLRDRLQRFPDNPQRDRWNSENFRYFDFDVLMTNPPFAGDIKDPRILHQFDLAKKADGKWRNKVGRDILFIQRNLEFLKPGGRMAIVLPQGRMNNTTDKAIRDFIADHARILAVVGLHGNTFKPHTGTKTSVLFVQKWNDDPSASPRLRCPNVDDYSIFFATSQHGGKDTSGEYVYLTDDNGRRLYDLHAHPMVDHDLFNLRAYLADQLEQRMAVAETDAQRQAILDAYDAKLPFVPDRPGIADAFRIWGPEQGFGFCSDDGGGQLVAVWSEVAWCALTDDKRLDAEHYRPEYLRQEGVIESLPHERLDVVADVTDGNHISIAEQFAESGIRYLRGQDLSDFFVSDSDPKFVPEATFRTLRRSHMKVGDVLLGVIATIGTVSLITDRFDKLTGNCKIAILRPHGIESEYLAAYFASPVGQRELHRRARGTVQTGVILPDLKAMPIPLLDIATRSKVKKKIRDAYAQRKQAEDAYVGAEALLESALGVDKLDLTPWLFYERPYADVQAASRFDAEYFQPRMQNLIAALSRDGQTIADVAKVSKRRFKPKAGTEFQYIEIGDVFGSGTADSNRVAGEDAPNRATWIVKRGDIITTTVRPIRRLSAIITNDQNGSVCSSGFAVLTPRNAKSRSKKLRFIDKGLAVSNA